MMSLYEGEKIRFRVDSKLSEKFEVKVGMHQGSVLPPFFFAMVVDVVTELSREDALSELFYNDDLVQMSETMEGFRDKFLKWKEAFESKSLKLNFGKTKVMVSVGKTKDGLSKSEVNPCEVCSRTDA